MLIIKEENLKKYLEDVKMESYFEEIKNLSEECDVMYSVTKETNDNPEYTHVVNMYDTIEKARCEFDDLCQSNKYACLSEEISVVLLNSEIK